MLIYSYLSNCKQRVKISDFYSSWTEILFGVPQRSILGSLLFNVLICDMFSFIEDFKIVNYAEDLTPFSAKVNHEPVVEELEVSSSVLFTWLRNNYIKANTDERHLLLSGSNKLTANINGNVIESENNQILLVTIDSNLPLNKNINNVSKKFSAKLNAVTKI